MMSILKLSTPILQVVLALFPLKPLQVHIKNVLAWPHNKHKIALKSLPTWNCTDWSIFGHLNSKIILKSNIQVFFFHPNNKIGSYDRPVGVTRNIFVGEHKWTRCISERAKRNGWFLLFFFLFCLGKIGGQNLWLGGSPSPPPCATTATNMFFFYHYAVSSLLSEKQLWNIHPIKIQARFYPMWTHLFCHLTQDKQAWAQLYASQ